MYRVSHQVKVGFLICLLSLCLTIFNSCSSKPRTYVDAKSYQTIILIPGFRASILADENRRTYWINAYEALFGSTPLTLPNDALGLQNLQLHSETLLRRVRIIPALYEFDIYDSFLRRIKRDFPQDKVVEFHYDWRQDNIEAVRALAYLVDQERQGGATTITLVAHSMGGLITSYYLRYGNSDFNNAVENWQGAEKVTNVILAGTPFYGAYEIFHDMQIGERTALNSSLLSAEALSSFPASYQLLPQFPDGATLPATFNILDAANWEKHGWGLLNNLNSHSTEIQNARRAFTTHNLTRASQLSRLLNTPSQHSPVQLKNIRLLNVIGSGRETDGKMRWDEERQSLDFENPVVENGDGIVTHQSASLPSSYISALFSQQIEVDSKHMDLLKSENFYSSFKEIVQPTLN